MLDRETKSTYNLVVTARDSAKDIDKRLSSTVQVRRSRVSEFFTLSVFHAFVCSSSRKTGSILKQLWVLPGTCYNSLMGSMNFSSHKRCSHAVDSTKAIDVYLTLNNFHLHMAIDAPSWFSVISLPAIRTFSLFEAPLDTLFWVRVGVALEGKSS